MRTHSSPSSYCAKQFSDQMDATPDELECLCGERYIEDQRLSTYKQESLLPVKLLGHAGRQVLQVPQKCNHLPDFIVAQ
jgi:hypothetical protein